ncbi:MAG TPA: PIN domain-containing protein [Chloroflexota bacterium]|nr:PIN domain-containing protein [Chloroflexota bacterium]
MNVELTFRFIGAVAFGAAGWNIGSNFTLPASNGGALPAELIGAAIGIVVGFVLTPYLTTRPTGFVADHARRLPVKDLVAAVLGLLISLVLSALLAIPLAMLPGIFGRILPFAACLFLSYLGITIFVGRRDDIFGLLGWFDSVGHEDASTGGVLLDTSAIIDGRIADVGRTGFLTGPLLVPRFVLRELQHIADSPDALRRSRGRRGLELLDRLKKNATVPVRICDIEVEGDGVDAKLIRLAQKLRCAIVTNDYNLNRVAALQGVRVLNVNELANAVKTVVLPGEEIVVRVIQEGKEPGQGVGYLDDGTMVVVDGGRQHLDSDVGIVVTRVFQTAAGRMIFAQAKENQSRHDAPAR